MGFSLRWLLLGRTGSRMHGLSSCSMGLSSCGFWAQERRVNHCVTEVQLLCGLWDLPRSGIDPISPVLAGRFLTSAPPGKPYTWLFDTIKSGTVYTFDTAIEFQIVTFLIQNLAEGLAHSKLSVSELSPKFSLLVSRPKAFA